MGNGKKYKSKRQLKKEGVVPQNKLKDMGLIKNAEWTDELGDRSWKEGPFRNRAVETWNGTKRIYKKGKEEGYDGDLWNIKKKKEYGVGFTEEVDGKTYNVSKTITTKHKKDGTVKVKERYEDKEQRNMMRKVEKNKRKGKFGSDFVIPKTISEKKGL